MLRKLNFTERVKIPRGNVRVVLRRDADGVLLFDPQLSFDGVAAAPTARVFIEAYYRTAFMRFDCGSVADFAPPEDRRLTEIDGTSLVRFRVKVVENDFRVVAVADGIVVSAQTPETSGRVPLLPVNFTAELEQQAWRIDFGVEGPVLELNNRFPSIKEAAKSDAVFFALVYPAAVRQVLMQILLVDRHDAHDDGDEWWNLWLRWAARYAAPLPKDGEEAAFWIDDVVAAFCNEQKVVDRWRASRGEGR
jgi:hypothetical protein